ncbi:MAG: DUF1289 domain-containing protein [Rhodospirillales bacterium]|jgi:predicted Fe-S protein YdhL (DUF1289 family)
MAVPSPCIDVCRFDGRTGWCVACLRTREEARGWKRMTDHRRHAVLAEAKRRRAKLTAAEFDVDR